MVKFFVGKKAVVFCFSFLIIIMGLMSYFGLPRESVPEIKQPYIFVTTLYPGVAAKDMENLVTREVESEIDGLEGILELTSSSQQSISFVFVKFSSDIEVETALRKVRERVDIAKTNIPAEAEEPVVTELSSSNWPIFITALSHPDGLEMIDRAADLVEEELKRVPGVLDVNVDGKLEKEIAIDLDPEKLEHYGLSIDKVIRGVQSEIINIPGGNLKNEAKNFTLSVTGEIRDAHLFADIVIKNEGKKIRLDELGKVQFKWAEPLTYSRINQIPCVSFSLTKRSGENIIEIVDGAKKVLNDLKPQLPVRTVINHSYDESQAIRNMVADLENNILTAFILVMLVTIFFLGKRNALFVSLAIPFSMLMSFFILQMMGITLNMVVLFSLVIALGMLVDNGIVIVENIYRHGAMGKNKEQAAIEGSQEVSMPIIASTITTLLAFFPIIFMPDVMGDFMSYLPKTVIVVLASSLFVALTINPVFCSRFLNTTGDDRKRFTEGSGRFAAIQNWYEAKIRIAIKNRKKVLFGSFIIVFLGIILNGMFGKETIFFPNLDPETAIVTVEGPHGTPLDSTDIIVREIEEIIPNSPASLKNYKSTTGREGGNDPFAGMGEEFHKASVRVEFKAFLERDIPGRVAIDSLKPKLKHLTGADIKVIEADMGPPTGNDVSYEVTGYDYAISGAIADSILLILLKYSEFKTVDSDFEPAKPEIAVDVDRKKAAFYGLSTMEVASTIRNSISGATVGKFRQRENEYDINVRYEKNYRNSLNMLSNLHVVNHDDERIPLSSVANIRTRSSVATIQRRNLRRAVQVWADFKEGIQTKRVIKAEIEEQVQKLEIPNGYRVGPGGGFTMRKDATEFLMRAFIVAIFLIIMVLIAQFNSLVQPVIIISAVFLSLGGVFWGYLITRMDFVIIMSGIGCIALAGVVVNNCIVLVDYTNLLIKNGMHWEQAIVEAGKTRLRPVLLTAITTVLGLMPMAIGVSIDFHNISLQIGSDSGQFWVAFAWAMIYGLTFATLMTLVVVPCGLSVHFKYTLGKKQSETDAIRTEQY